MSELIDSTLDQASTPANAVAKVNLLGLTRQKMAAFFLSIGEKKFCAEQVLKWLHHHRVDDFDQMTNVSKVLREEKMTATFSS